MAQLIFPPNPTNNQRYTGDNGVTYVYQSPPGVWTAPSNGGGGGPYVYGAGSWNSVALPLNRVNGSPIAYVNGKFVVQAESGTGKFLTSTNGFNWNSEGDSPANLTFVGGANGLFICYNSTNKLAYTSPDLTNWTPGSVAVPGRGSDFKNITGNGTTFVATSVRDDGSNLAIALHSTNGRDWTEVTTSYGLFYAPPRPIANGAYILSLQSQNQPPQPYVSTNGGLSYSPAPFSFPTGQNSDLSTSASDGTYAYFISNSPSGAPVTSYLSRLYWTDGTGTNSFSIDLGTVRTDNPGTGTYTGGFTASGNGYCQMGGGLAYGGSIAGFGTGLFTQLPNSVGLLQSIRTGILGAGGGVTDGVGTAVIPYGPTLRSIWVCKLG